MAAVAQIVVLVLTIWTAVSFVAAVAIGRTLRRAEPIPLRVSDQQPFIRRVR